MNKGLSLLAFLSLSVSLIGQHHGQYGGGSGVPKVGVVSGVVLDETSSSPIEYATVGVMNLRDSSIVSGTVTDAKGKFRIEELPFGRFILQVSFIGFDNYYSEPFGINPKTGTEKDFGEIKVKPSSAAVEEVDVVVDKPIISTSIDKKVFSAEKNITAAGGSAVDVLNNVPSVAVDQDGVVSLRGNSNVTVLIDGKPSGLTGGGRQALLEQIPASNIQDIEVITNPSAKYDPDGLSGIINIKLKKNKLKGVNGYINYTVGTDGHPADGNSVINKHNVNTQLSFKNKKLNLYGNYSYNNRTTGMVNAVYQDVFYSDFVSSLDQFDLGIRQRAANMVKGGVDYYLNKKNTLSLSTTYNFNTHDHQRDILYQTLSDEVLLGESERIALEETKGNSTDINFTHDLDLDDKGSELTTSINYSDGGRREESDFDEFVTDSLTEQQNTIQNRGNTIVTVQSDLVKKFNKKTKLEAGWKYIGRNIDNDFYSESFDPVVNEIVEDTLLSNHFNYDEKIIGVYGMGFYKINDKWAVQGGLRAEQAYTLSTLINTGDTFSNDYFKLYPSGYVQYTIKDSARESSSVTASYSRRINRPRTGVLNPFVDYSNPNSIRQGNPFLKPEFIDSYELTYSLFKNGIGFNTSAYFKHTTDQISRASFLSNQVRYMLWQNVGIARSFGLEASVSGKIAPFLRIVVSGNGNWNQSRGEAINESLNDTVSLDNDAFGFRGNIILNFKIKKTYDLQITSWYRAPMNIAQGRIYSMKSVDLALKRTFKKKFDVSIRLSDLFNTQYFSMLLEDLDDTGNAFVSDRTHDWESQNVYLSLAYRFGSNQNGRGKWGRRGGKNKGNEGTFDGGGGGEGM